VRDHRQVAREIATLSFNPTRIRNLTRHFFAETQRASWELLSDVVKRNTLAIAS